MKLIGVVFLVCLVIVVISFVTYVVESIGALRESQRVQGFKLDRLLIRCHNRPRE